jgi:SAM-dependent methyltransferase
MKTFQEFFLLAMKREIPELIDVEGPALNLGAGFSEIPRAISHSIETGWDADYQIIPYQDNSIATIHAYHFLEHLNNPVKVLLECQRVLRIGGVMNVCVPYYNSNLASQDLDHKKFFTEETWRTLFNSTGYDKNKINWELRERFNVICGIVERNLCLLTQLEKVAITTK